ncbi:MAG: energy-coupling factor transporter transmembrane protein EcfT, partial [Candidatus Thermoplasmatota archaeon]|nr:energy-coupling factor transporter transmembrane protein EcfT [Candidatus Thermoplasmatota archaeon]
GGRMARIRHRMPVIIPLFHSSLERAVGTAEAMEARGFGSTDRTRWIRRGWRTSDALAMTAAFTIAVMSIVLSLWGDGHPVYYPTIDLDASSLTLVWQTVLVALIAFPALIGPRGGDHSG